MAAEATKRQPRAVVATPASDQISGDGAKCGRRRRRLERSVRTYRAKSATNGSGAGAPQAPGWVTFKVNWRGWSIFQPADTCARRLLRRRVGGDHVRAVARSRCLGLCAFDGAGACSGWFGSSVRVRLAIVRRTVSPSTPAVCAM